jgi:hypothetical protein
MKYWVRGQVLVQRFSTWDTQADDWGYAKRLYGYNFLFGGTHGGTILICGYADEYNSYLGVRRGVKFQIGVCE